MKKVWCEFLTDMVMLGTILLLLQMNAGASRKQCGIPIYQWLDVFFALFGLRSFYQLLKIYIIRNYYHRVFCFDLMKLVFIDGALVAWLIYGNSLYYSPLNDCARLPET